MTIVNLTPHPIRIYHPNVPDRIDVDGEHEPLCTIEPSGRLARLGMDELSLHAVVQHSGLPIPLECVDYGDLTGLPDWDGSADGETPRTFLLVPLVVALAARGRLDLLVPYREVRNPTGTVIGCRALARVA